VPNTHADLAPLPHSPWMILLLAARHYISTTTPASLATKLNSKRSMVANTITCKTALSQSAIFKTDPTSDGRSPHPTAAGRTSRCVSVPFATVPTFTERPQLWQELLEKLEKAHGTGLAHTVAVTGLGGTGKTQLVLRYIEEHEEDYDAVLWIDVRSEETARSSYERCCRTAGLPIEAATGDVPLQGVPAVQAVLSWLRSKGEDKRWLAVVDNADDLSWDVSSVIPKGEAGTVIVTSQDAQVARLLGGRTPTVKVDAMEPEEAVCLVLNYFEDFVCHGDACFVLAEEITECLDRLALAIDLAGARIQVDVENGDDLATALRQYLTDYRRYQGKLLRDEEFSRVSAYKKTVWTAWETSLASLRELEDSQPNVYPVQLLSFVTLLSRTNVQDELFRLASLGLEEACHRLDVRTPAWMRGLLAKREDEKWDDFSYRATVKLLVRYGLVRPVIEPWKGITMHGLVRWRAGVGMDREQYWRLYLAFMVAVCGNIGEKADSVRFRRQVVVHLPLKDDLLGRKDDMECEGLWWVWTMIGHMLWQEGRWKEAEELLVKVVEITLTVLGKEHPDTLSAMVNLAATYRSQGRPVEAGAVFVKVVEARRRVLGKKHLDTLTAMAHLGATYQDQGRSKEAEELGVKVMEARSRVLGEEHLDTLSAMANLASTYRNQGRWKMANELEVKVMEVRSRVLGEEHPDTLTAMANLASTCWKQGWWKEAEEQFFKVMEAMSGVIGEEHPSTLTAMANLASVYTSQERWSEAEELQVKVMEARSRALGEEHPKTLSAMANLAYTKKGLGKYFIAAELMRRSATVSSKIFGGSRPVFLSRYEQAAAWSGVRAS
jgi:tetratricopeptide (TPR) repeat protein